MFPMLNISRLAALFISLAPLSVWAAPQQGEVRLETGARLTWSLSDYTATPALGIAIPATIAWTAAGLDVPIKIDLSMASPRRSI